MVLPDRIELSTSPLPMECSTTELRQHARESRNRPKRPLQAAGSCHKAPAGASTRALGNATKTAKIGFRRPRRAWDASTRASSGSTSPFQGPRAGLSHRLFCEHATTFPTGFALTNDFNKAERQGAAA